MPYPPVTTDTEYLAAQAELEPIRSAQKGTQEFARAIEIGGAIARYLHDHGARNPDGYTAESIKVLKGLDPPIRRDDRHVTPEDPDEC
jgi:hypothetical protein